jgi:hypothetical protein
MSKLGERKYGSSTEATMLGLEYASGKFRGFAILECSAQYEFLGACKKIEAHYN